jgi:hypothetical protein
MNIDLSAPAFPRKVEEEIATAEASQPTSGQEEQEPSTSGEVPVVEEQRVPYSRLKSQIDARRDAEERAELAEENYQRLLNEERSRPEPTKAQDGEIPSYWLRMYGDTDNSREAYKYELERQQSITDTARREAVEAVRAERSNESQTLSRNERTIDNKLEDLSESLGRPLTETEEGALLDIVDEYTPTDEDGNYSGDLISMDKAWEILSLQQNASGQRTRRARSTATSLTSQRTESESGDTEKENANWNPRDWNSWKKRIPNG